MKKRFKTLLSFGLFLQTFLLLANSSWAQTATSTLDQPVSKPILIVFILFCLSLAPFLIMMTTSFVKIAVVLSLVRQAIGVQQIPPNQVVTGLAIILSIYVMVPVAQDIYQETQDVIRVAESDQPILSTASLDVLKKAFEKAKEPVRKFLDRHVNDKERELFFTKSKNLKLDKTQDSKVTPKDFIVLIPAFVISELSQAFQIGFVIFLPFLIIDMVISNILLSMGMFQLSPVTVSLPFKLLLFVLVDGWYLITDGLVKTYLVT